MAQVLTAEDRKTIEKSLEDLKTAKAEIARAKLAGIDVSDFTEQVEALTTQLEKLKAAYFPRT